MRDRNKLRTLFLWVGISALMFAPLEGAGKRAVRLPVVSRSSPAAVKYHKHRIELVWKLPKPSLSEAVEEDGKLYTHVRLAGAGSRAEPGLPELPVIETLVATPRIRPLPRVLLKDCVWKEAALSSPVVPAQKPVPKTPGARRARRFRRNSSFYQGKGFRNPWAVSLGKWYRLRPVRRAKKDYFRLELFLYSFDPDRLKLKYPRECRVVLSWIQGRAVTRPHARKRREPVRRLKVKISGPEDLRFLCRRGFDIGGRKGGDVIIYATPQEEEELRGKGFDFRMTPDEAKEKARLLARSKGIGPGHYHSFQTLTAFLEDMALQYPGLCTVESIGRSVEGRELWACKISDNVAVNEEEPEVRLLAGMHGNEPPATELCVYFIDYLLSRYVENARITDIVNGLEIWFIPLMNPDALMNGDRYNANGVDLNRGFPDRIQDPVDSPVGREPEVAAVMNFCDQHDFTLAANFHAGALVVNYPYDSNESGEPVYTAAADDSLFRYISRLYADENPAMRESELFPGGITNGADWYVIYGGLQDWSYVWQGTNEVTVEICEEPWPEEAALSDIWDENRQSLLAYVESAFTAVSGTVYDRATGEPLSYAQVRAEGIDHATCVNPRTGTYHRMIEQGVYAFTFSAPGYEPKTVREVEVAEGRISPLDAGLERTRKSNGRNVLVVAAESLSKGGEGITAYYTDRGFSADLLSFQGGTSRQGIRELIRGKYQNWNFDYLLLLGDTDTLPGFFKEDPSSDGHHSDLLYSLLDPGESWSDYEGTDAITARIPLRTNEEVSLYVGKLREFLDYQRDRRFVWVSQGQDREECDTARETHEWVIENIVPDDLRNVSFTCSQGTLSDFVAELNEGVDLVTYSGHAQWDRWDKWGFDKGELELLNNAGDPPIVFSYACDSGRYKQEVCFGEAWIATSRRAAAFVGASGPTYWEEDDWLEKSEWRELFGDRPATLGESLSRALAYVARKSTEGQYYHEIYHLFGDPTLKVRGRIRVEKKSWADGGNGVMEPGETGEFELVLGNAWGEELHNAEATFQAESDYVSVLSGYYEIGDISSQEPFTASFLVNVSPGCPAGETVPFGVELVSDERAGSVTGSFQVHVVSTVSGRVVIEDGAGPAEGVTVEAVGARTDTCETGPDGLFSLSLLEGSYLVAAQKAGYFREEESITVPPGMDGLDFSLGWAEGELEPESLHITTLPEEEKENAVFLRNVGTRPLSFRLGLRRDNGGVPCPEDVDYGIREDPGGAFVSWVDMSNATVVAEGGPGQDDKSWGPLPLPFTFPFYGQNWEEIYVDSNGCITFFEATDAFANEPLPSAAAPPYVIAVLWDDLKIPAGGSVRFLKEPERCVLEFARASSYDKGGEFSFQLHLFKDGRVLFMYRDVPWEDLTPTVGIQNGIKTQGLTVARDELTDGVVLLGIESESSGESECSGYSRVLTPEDPGGPVHDWVDMSEATVIHQGEADEEIWGPFTIPAFRFYEASYEEVYISSNGFIAFAEPGGNFYENSFLPSPDAPSAMVAGLWDDLSVTKDGAVLLLQEDSRCVIEYNGVRHFEGVAAFAFQIILLKGGGIKIQYRDLPRGEVTPTVGIQDGQRTRGLMAVPSQLEGGVVLFSKWPAWIEADATAGEVPAGGKAEVVFTVTGGRAGETLQATCVFYTNSPGRPQLELPVMVEARQGYYFVRGDGNQDRQVDLSDAVFVLNYLFRSGDTGCLAALDTNKNGDVEIGDAVFILNFLFGDGRAPPPPFPECGLFDEFTPLSCENPTCPPEATSGE